MNCGTQKSFNYRERGYEKDILTGQYAQIIKNSENKIQLFYQGHPNEEKLTNRQLAICYAEEESENFKRINLNNYKLKLMRIIILFNGRT